MKSPAPVTSIVPAPQFKADVEITVPGQIETGTASFTFKYHTRDEMRALWDKHSELVPIPETLKDSHVVEDGIPDGMMRRYNTTPELLQEILIGWGFSSEYNLENLKTFMSNFAFAGPEIMAAYSKLLFDSRIKN